MEYSTGSEKADQALAEDIALAKQGDPFAHANLGLYLCGELCLGPKPEEILQIKTALPSKLQQIHEWDVKPDYVKSYAHFLMADTIKGNNSNVRKKLANQMTLEEIETAKQIAKEWEAQAKEQKKLQVKGDVQ